jgi:hypothetical protein
MYPRCPNCGRNLAFPLAQCTGGRCPHCRYSDGARKTFHRTDPVPPDVPRCSGQTYYRVESEPNYEKPDGEPEKSKTDWLGIAFDVVKFAAAVAALVLMASEDGSKKGKRKR